MNFMLIAVIVLDLCKIIGEAINALLVLSPVKIGFPVALCVRHPFISHAKLAIVLGILISLWSQLGKPK